MARGPFMHGSSVFHDPDLRHKQVLMVGRAARGIYN